MPNSTLNTRHSALRASIAPYLESAPLAALALGVSSGFTFAMIGATLTTRLAQHGVTKSAVTAFALTFLAYNFKFLWAPIVDNVRLPVIGRFGQRRSCCGIDTQVHSVLMQRGDLVGGHEASASLGPQHDSVEDVFRGSGDDVFDRSHLLAIRGVDRNTLVQHLVGDRMAFIHPANVTFAGPRCVLPAPPTRRNVVGHGGLQGG